MKKREMKKMLLAVIGIVLVGTGISFNAAAALGNDPIGMMYDGIRNIAKLSLRQLGMASNIVNATLVIVVFMAKRKYVNIGTFVYIIPYGLVVDLGGRLYPVLFRVQSLPTQIMGAVTGCLLLYLGVAMFITADIGLDPFTGLVMVIRDKVGREYRTVKVFFDFACIAIGFALGGKLGVITILTAFFAGPVIQFFSDEMKKHIS